VRIMEGKKKTEAGECSIGVGPKRFNCFFSGLCLGKLGWNAEKDSNISDLFLVLKKWLVEQ